MENSDKFGLPIVKDNYRRPYTKEEEEMLRELYKTKKAKEIALIMGRTYLSVISKINAMGLYKYN